MKLSASAFSFTAFTLVLGACASNTPGSGTHRSLSSVDTRKFLYEFELDREAGETYRPEDNLKSEQREYQRLIDLFSTHFHKKYGSAQSRQSQKDQNESGYALRGVHAKGHGCLAGEFMVLRHAKPELAFGVFRQPKKHKIVLRFSNGDGPPERDSNNTISIGMAFKLFGVEEEKLLGALQKEESADFLMTNHPNFIVADIREFAEVIEGRENGLLDKAGAIRVAGRGLYQRTKVAKNDPLATAYWGNLPFKLGSTVVKYLARPETCPGEKESGEVAVTKADRSNPDFLSAALTQHIRAHSACFGFYLQKQAADKTKSPVEDATVSWPEEGTVTRVALLKIPAQEPNALLSTLPLVGGRGKGKEICQHLSFSPWNTTADFKPLSSLNRARRVIYELSTEMRRDINRAENPAEGR